MKRILTVILVLSLATVACGMDVTLPTAVPIGPEVTTSLDVAVPAGTDPLDLQLEFGAGKLTLAPGAGDLLVEGTATYNIDDFAPETRVDGRRVVIEQGSYDTVGFPNLSDIKNEWDLRLGSVPMALTVLGGAYSAEFELGGLHLTGLTIKDGASDVKVNFSEPNLEEMAFLRYETCASNITMFGLANANFSTLVFKGGAGNYRLDFSGDLQHDATVTIQTGVSNITLVIPEGVAAEVTVEGLSNVSLGSGWAQNGKTYTQAGDGPRLVILVQSGPGNLALTH